jgi:hypothetical protein
MSGAPASRAMYDGDDDDAAAAADDAADDDDADDADWIHPGSASFWRSTLT